MGLIRSKPFSQQYPRGTRLQAKGVNSANDWTGLKNGEWYTVIDCDDYGNVVVAELMKNNAVPWLTLADFDLESVMPNHNDIMKKLVK